MPEISCRPGQPETGGMRENIIWMCSGQPALSPTSPSTGFTFLFKKTVLSLWPAPRLSQLAWEESQLPRLAWLSGAPLCRHPSLHHRASGHSHRGIQRNEWTQIHPQLISGRDLQAPREHRLQKVLWKPRRVSRRTTRGWQRRHPASSQMQD